MSNSNEQVTNIVQLPLLPLRDVVVFPHMVIPLFVGRPKSIKALETAMEAGKSIVLVAQKSAAKDEPAPEDLYTIGTVANILQMLKLPDGTVKVLVEGSQRTHINQIVDVKTHFAVDATPIPADNEITHEVEAMRRTLVSQFDQYVKLNKKIPPEILTSLGGIDEPGRLADTIAAHLPLKLEQKQEVLEMFEAKKRLEHLLTLIEGELDILQVEKRIRGRVKRQMEKSQREYYLNEQVKAIQKELGELEEGADLDEMEKRIKAAHMPKEARKKAEAEFKKLRLMSPMSAEATVVRNYIDALVALPWKKKSKINTDLTAAEKVLDEDHYGLEKVKERIVEYLAVQQRVEKLKGPILCLVGAPGVGKTSLGQSIARATNRKFIRMSLGGVRDEAEIRGHRRTYIGSMPGKILQNMTKVGVRNPLFLLDEVDKMGMDFRGDPASALLEVLDPEQNHTFVDHYVEVEYDLSDVMFVATANTLNIPPALLDRMEVIRLSGYTELEKLEIAKRFLVPKQKEQTGISSKQVEFTDEGLNGLIQFYTREAGVRNLEREIGNVCRKLARKVVDLQTATAKESGGKESKPKTEAPAAIINGAKLVDLLGPTKFRDLTADKKNEIGAAVGLAWTEVGGQILTTEAILMEGKGKLTVTGKLGDVMQESAQAAMSYIRSRAHQFGLPRDFYRNLDIHLHIPEGAIPKDGPSAGITMATTIASALTKIPVRGDVAMTGEITLRGKVLPIGGLKEKLLAAHRHGIAEAIMPLDNQKDLPDIPDNVKSTMKLHFVESMDEVLKIALEREIVALPLVPAGPAVEVAQPAEENRAH